ncbi:hypothetical protein [Paraburkholderia xenovorans]
MTTVKGGIVASALVLGFAAAAHAQLVARPGNAGAGGMSGLQSNGINNMGGAPATGLGTSPAPAVGRVGGAGSGPALSNMRANGTSLNMNPDPRVPNLAGKALPQN